MAPGRAPKPGAPGGGGPAGQRGVNIVFRAGLLYNGVTFAGARGLPGGAAARFGGEAVKKERRIVVKVGTSTLTHPSGKLFLERIDKLARVVSDVQNAGHKVVLVTSGAIGVGVSAIGLPRRPEELKYKQAAAAIGQCRLMHLYDKLFGEYGRVVSQILLSRPDTDIPERRENLLRTFEALLEWDVLPIVNENDSVSPEEIESARSKIFGDNDTLSAIVARLIRADLLVLLTDIDGLYDADPHQNPGARLVPRVSEITPALRQASGGAGSARGTGGMQTKLAAAEIALECGFDMVVANGASPSLLAEIVAGKDVGTLFRRD